LVLPNRVTNRNAGGLSRREARSLPYAIFWR